MQIPEFILAIIEKFLAGKANADEKKQLQDWYRQQELEEVIVPSENDAEDNTAKRIQERLNQTIEQMEQPKQNKPLERRLPLWTKIAAAVIILLVCSIVYFQTSRPSVAKPGHQPDILPASDQIVLTLANGKQIALDSLANGMITAEGKTKIVKHQANELSYNPETGSMLSEPAVMYNSISTPKGRQYQVVLSDNSRVWLNAASSLRFPAAFSGRERVVELTGEAYFEIAALNSKNGKKMPFKVIIAPSASGETRGEVEVLGTHFNIMAYHDEQSISTTLLEGSVKITSAQHGSAIIKPGQQASIPAAGNINVDEVDTDEVIAWKKGLFYFKSADISHIMRQLSRWYDIEVRYEGGIPADRLTGIINRSASLSKVMQALAMNNIHYRLENKTLFISEK